jgi:hypothetical protein
MTAATEHGAETARRLLLGMRTAVTCIAAAVVLTASLPRKAGIHDPLWPQLIAYGIVAGLLLVEVMLLIWRRSWGRLRVPALAAVMAASILATWTLDARYVTTSTDWSFGTTCWIAVILLLDRPLAQLVAFLTAHELVTVTRALVLGPSDADFFLNLVAGSVGTFGFPLACAIATTGLRGVARQAGEDVAEFYRIRTAAAVRSEAHARRQARMAELNVVAEPLLHGLATGSLSAADPAVQRDCAIEAARMRRFFAETDEVEDPLTHELLGCADVATRRGVIVEFDSAGAWPVPPLVVRRALTEAPIAVLASAATTARICVIGTPGSLVVSVSADGGGWRVPEATTSGVGRRTITEDGMIWSESEWTVQW